MKCYRPLEGWKSALPNKNGEYPVVFKPELGQGKRMLLPCGTCDACNIAKANQSAIRVMHEASTHQENSFITLTYNDRNLPTVTNVPTIRTKDLQDFFKRLRKTGKKVRYYAGSEYGSANNRPHYHICLFGYRFSDLVRLCRKATFTNPYPKPLHTSPHLSDIWGKGYVSQGELTFQSASYVARYCMKKGYGADAHHKYKFNYDALTDTKLPFSEWTTDPDNHIYQLSIEPERTYCSLKPGIGALWLEKYWKDISEDGYISVRKVHKGKIDYYPMRVPRYYLRLLERYPINTPQHDLFLNIREHTLDYVRNNPDDWYETEREAKLNTRRTLAKRRAVELPRNVQFDHLEVAV